MSMKPVERWRQRLADADHHAVAFVRTHANLFTAIVVAVLCLWAVTAGNVLFVIGVLAVGAVSYFAGLLTGLGAGCVFAAVLLYLGWRYGGLDLSAWLLQGVGFAGTAWLGYFHKAQKEWAEARLRQRDPHAPQVLPWAVVNEVRTSLAAIRFLLFPLHSESERQELQRATDELSRLEQLFSELERNGKLPEGTAQEPDERARPTKRPVSHDRRSGT
ncbi:MAG: hypothetical protein K6T31_06170 [Alicyclobacillus sp.]|nr:hypothetical protein [Alicyclobacillus sp.]